MDFDDVSYDDHADMLYDLAAQTIDHFRGMSYKDDDIRKVLRCHQRQIANFIHVQMLDHYWTEPVEYDVVVSKGFTELKESAYTAVAKDSILDFRRPPTDKSKIGQYVYTGFARCLYRLQKFQVDTERKMAIVLDRDSLKWFRPALGQFQIHYRIGHEEQKPTPSSP